MQPQTRQEISEKHQGILRHTTGSIGLRKDWGYRNRFIANINGGDYLILKQMEKLGLVKQAYINGSNIHFEATAEGMRAIGFNEAEIQKCINEN
jgi:hypothetical protein